MSDLHDYEQALVEAVRRAVLAGQGDLRGIELRGTYPDTEIVLTMGDLVPGQEMEWSYPFWGSAMVEDGEPRMPVAGLATIIWANLIEG